MYSERNGSEMFDIVETLVVKTENVNRRRNCLTWFVRVPKTFEKEQCTPFDALNALALKGEILRCSSCTVED